MIIAILSDKMNWQENSLVFNKKYENDVYPIVKAFYPEEIVKVYGEEEIAQVDFEQDQNEFTSVSSKIYMNFEETLITIRIELSQEEPFLQAITLDGTFSKTQYKNAMKRLLYQMLSSITKKELPWGILTGIRPTKLVYEMLENHEDDNTIQLKMKEEYLCSQRKTEMSIRIAKREIELLREMDYQNGYSLYIGIPFCPSTCLYCSFTSYSIDKFSDLVEDYLKALAKEIEYGAACFPQKKLTTVYFGGGTPTTLSAGQLDLLLGLVKKSFDFTNVKEFCVEAGRPDSITKEKLEVLKKWGVDRISINPQSMQQKTLDLIGRKHTVEQIKEAFQLARETGHDNINMDIIIGLPDEKLDDVTDTLKQIKDLNPDSLTVHTLALKRAARLNLEKEHYKSRKASNVPGMLNTAIQFAEDNDYLPYYLYRQKNMADNLENIGYAKYGKEGLYNILIMEEKQTILALGAGGMSKFVFPDENRIERVDNVKSITDYVGRIDEMIDKKKQFLIKNR